MADKPTPDFSGYVTKANLKCSDGRTIMKDAFAHQDKAKVTLVYNHGQNDIENTLGHMILENREDGVYGYGYFNDSEKAKHAKIAVQHEDIDAMSIWANKLVERSKQVFHGMIREVSLVMAGANPGAKIDFINLAHGEYQFAEDGEPAEEMIAFSGEKLQHDDTVEVPEFAAEGDEGDEGASSEGAPSSDEGDESGTVEHADGETILDVLNTMPAPAKDALSSAIATAVKGGTIEHADKAVLDLLDAKQKDAVSWAIGVAAMGDSAAHSDTNDEGNLGHQEGSHEMNVFEQNATGQATPGQPALTHSQRQELAQKTMADVAKHGGSFRDSFLAHVVDYGIENIDYLFPDAKTVMDSPEFVARRMEWVATVLAGVKRNPFSRIKTLSADITHDEARAKGYVKGNLKKEEWFGLNKRSTSPTTIYKKQKLDRDDIIDITDLDVVAWLKAEMRIMLDEEVARAILLGDGREVDDEDHIADGSVDGIGIRPIAFEDEFYAHRVVLDTNVTPDGVVESVLRNRKYYRGSGNPTMFCTEDLLADLLLQKGRDGHRLYNTQADLQVALRVSNIVTVPVMEDLQADDGEVQAILVNLNDYTVGADRGGQIAMFDDFDIDYNQYKYLIEGRMSGALTRFKTAMVFVRTNGTEVTPTTPTFNTTSGVLTVPSVTGVVYKNDETDATLSSGAQTAIASGDTFYVRAEPTSGHYFPHNFDADWEFTRA